MKLLVESASSPGSFRDARKKVRSLVGFCANGKNRYGSIRSFKWFAGPSSTMPTICRSLPFTLTHSPHGRGPAGKEAAGDRGVAPRPGGGRGPVNRQKRAPPDPPPAGHREIVRAHLVV